MNTGRQDLPVGVPVAIPANAGTNWPDPPTAGASDGSAATKDETSVAAVFRHPERRRGPGVPGLNELSRLLSDRDLAVLTAVARHRFLTSRHVQQFVFRGHASTSSAARVCRRVLKRLEGQGLLQRPLRRIGGLTAGSASSVWLISSRGLRLLNLRAGKGAVGRVREPGERFVQHYLAIADLHLALLAAEQAGQLTVVELELEPGCWRSFTGIGGGRATLKPDLFAITAAKPVAGAAAYEDLWFIEVDRGTESLPTLLRQCRAYETYRRHGQEQTERGAYPLVAWIMPDEVRAAKLRSAIAAARDLDTDLYRVTTMTGVTALLVGDAP